MRILHFDSDDLDNPLRGGQPVRTYEVNKRLAQANTIRVFTATYPGAKREIERESIQYQRLGFQVPGFGLSPHLSFLASIGITTRRVPHDLVIEEFAPPVGFCFSPWFTSQPVLSVVQWFYFAEWRKRYGLPFEKIMCSIARTRRYQHFIVQTQAMEKYFSALLPDAQIWRLGCGVDDSLFMPPGPSDDYALYLGRLDVDHKGLDLLLQTWSANKAAGSIIPLKIVGEGPGREFLAREIAARGLQSEISLLGRLEGEAKREVLRNSAFLVMPSRRETFGLAALEAMAASKPVVAFDIENLNEVLDRDWAFLAQPFDIRSFAEACEHLWSTREKRAQFGARGFKAAQSFRWDAIAAKQQSIYHEVMGRHHA